MTKLAKWGEGECFTRVFVTDDGREGIDITDERRQKICGSELVHLDAAYEAVERGKHHNVAPSIDTVSDEKAGSSSPLYRDCGMVMTDNVALGIDLRVDVSVTDDRVSDSVR